MTYAQTKIQRAKECVAETFDDLANIVLDDKEISVEEAAELIVKELEDWRVYYKNRFEFYEGLKTAIHQRIC